MSRFDSSVVRSVYQRVYLALSTYLKYIGKCYQITFRKIMPEYGYAYRNNITVSRTKLFDSLLPRHFYPHPPEKSKYKNGNVKLMNKNLIEGDNVICIGGGYGVTAITAARIVGSSGNVTVYEASKRQTEIIRDVIDLNCKNNNIDLIHGIVGENVHIYNGMGNPKHIQTTKLPDVDVVEMDCEGSEISILENMNINPRCMIIELHPHRYGEPRNKGIHVVEELGYQIVDVVDQYGDTIEYERFKMFMDGDSSDTLSTEFTKPFIISCVK